MAVISVANAQQLIAAVAAAKGGDVISLAPGDYGGISLKNLTFDAPVTLVSADPANPAVFDSLALRNVHNLTFASLEVDFVRGDAPDWVPAITADASSHLTFDGVHVHGTLNGDPSDDGFGMAINTSSFVTIRNSEFEQLSRGIVMSQGADIDVSNNDFHDIRAIATAFAQVQRVVVDGNRISDIYWREPDHPDAIQFLTSGTTASSSDIRITNNVIMTGDGNGMQGIFLSDEVGTLPYKNVYIGNNLVYVDSLYNGITVLHGENIQVVDNTVLSPSDDAVRLRIWMENVTGGHIEGNVAEFLLQTGTNGLTVADNLFLESSPANAALFPNLNLGPAATVGDFLIDGYGYHPSVEPPLSQQQQQPAQEATTTNESDSQATDVDSIADYVIEPPADTALNLDSHWVDPLMHGATYRNLDGPFVGGAPIGTDGIDAVSYLLGHADLAEAGLGARGALTHWLNEGAAEGRSADGGFGNERPSHALPIGAALEQALEASGDQDWFALQLTQGQDVELSLDGLGFDGTLSVHDSLGHQVAFADANGQSGGETLAFNPANAGLYYVVVASVDGLGSGEYMLGVDLVIGG